MLELYLLASIVFGLVFAASEAAEPDWSLPWLAFAFLMGATWPLIGAAWLVGQARRLLGKGSA